MTKPQDNTTLKAFGIAGAVIALFCCGAAGIVTAFDGDDQPQPAASTPAQRFVNPAGDQGAATTQPAVEPTTEPAVEDTAEPEPEPTTTKPKPKPTTRKPKPKPTTEEPEPEEVYYANCAAVRAAGADPIRRGDPGYGRHLDRDGDGVGCE